MPFIRRLFEPPSWKVIGPNKNINKIYSNTKYIIKNNIIFYNIKYIRVFEYAHDYLLTNSLGVSNEQASFIHIEF